MLGALLAVLASGAPSTANRAPLAWASCASSIKESVDKKYIVRLDNNLTIAVDTNMSVPGNTNLRELRKNHRYEVEADEDAYFINDMLPALMQQAKSDGRDHVVMIEVGSLWALRSLLFANAARDAGLIPLNIMVEPMALRLRAGQINFALNGRCPTTPEEPATKGSQPTWLQALICSPEEEQMNGYIGHDWWNKEVHAGCTSVREIVATRHLRRVDLLHGDLQGGEIEMLRGSPLELIRAVSLGTHSEAGHRDALAQLQRAAMPVTYSTDQKAANEGIIFARRPLDA